MVEILCGEDDEAEVPYSVTAATLLADSGIHQSDSDMTPSKVKMICSKSSGEEKKSHLTEATAAVNEQRGDSSQVFSLEAISDSNTEAISAITPSVETGKTLDNSTENTTAFGSDKQVRHVINEAAADVQDNVHSEETIPRWMVEMLCNSDEDENEGRDSSTSRETSAVDSRLDKHDGVSEDMSNTKTAMVKFGKKTKDKFSSSTSRGGRSRPRKTKPKTERVQKPTKALDGIKQSTQNFVQQWMAKEMPADWTEEKREDEFLIHGRRAGISHQQLYRSQVLKHAKYRSLGAITYQLRELSKKGVDVRPRTEEYQRRSIACARSNPHSEERELIIKMCREGESVRAIRESGIIKYGKNTVFAIKERIQAVKERGIDLTPRSEDAL
ncbi:MAG: hypothetical protein Q9228_005870 [Teloschistes exilis]